MKIIFFDIDGTLIPEGTKLIPESAIKAIKIARENGNICMINTGRPRSFVRQDLKSQVEFDGFLYGCGTEIEYKNEILMHKTFSLEDSLRIMEGVKRYGIDAVFEGEKNNYAGDVDSFVTKTFKKYAKTNMIDYYTNLEGAPGNFDKFFCCVEEQWRIEGFRQEFENELEFVDREHGFYEVLPKGYSKKTAIEYMEKYLNIDHKDTVAIGDSNNDIPMLEYANIAIGMGNSSEAVIKMADYVSTDCKQDGIYNALSWLGVL